MTDEFAGWPAEAPVLLGRLAADNTREFWAGNRERFTGVVLGPMRALAAALEPEFGAVRVFRPQVDRRFRPDAPPYRTDTGGVARGAGGATFGVLLTATALSVTAGHWVFDAPQLRRYRSAVDEEAELAAILDALHGLTVDGSRRLTGTPRGYPATHPRIGLLRHRGLQVGRGWDVGEWLQTDEPLRRVREAWRAAAPLVAWLAAHVGEPDPVPPRPRPPALPPDFTARADVAHSPRPDSVVTVGAGDGG